MRGAPLKVEVYINGRPESDYNPDELEKIRETLAERAYRAMGYVPVDEDEDPQRTPPEKAS